MRQFLIVTLLVNLMGGPAAAQAAPPAVPTVLAVLAHGHPFAGGTILTVTPLDALSTAGVQAATHTALRIGPHRFLFVVDRVAAISQPVGTTLVKLADGPRPLFELAALLGPALAGTADVAIFTRGTPDTGVVTAIIPLEAGRGPVRRAVDGATQVTIFQAGRETTAAIKPDTGRPMLVLDGSEQGSECRFCDSMGTMP